jgi:4-hydroxybenzoate polyprenyltransferase
MKNIFIKILDHIFLTRPMLWIPVWGYCFLGYFAGLGLNNKSNIKLFIQLPLEIFFWIFIFSCSVGSVYIINQIVDKEVDSDNSGIAIMAKENILKKEALITVFILILISIFVPFIKYPSFCLFSLLTIILGFFYNIKPFYFTGKPFLDFISNAVGFSFIAFGAGWYLSKSSFVTDYFIYALPYFFLMCAGSISSTIPDIEGDKKHGKNTTAVVLGISISHIIATLFIIATVFVSVLLADWISFLCSMAALPFYIIFLFKKNNITMEATYKIGGLIMMIIVGIIYPLFMIFCLLVLISTIIYFKKRFNVLYPSLVAKDDKK